MTSALIPANLALMVTSSHILSATLDTIMQERSLSRSQARRWLIEEIDRRKRIKVTEGNRTKHAEAMRRPNKFHRHPH